MKAVLLMAAVLAGLFLVQDAGACAVCYGDPESPLTKGLEKGVMVLVGVIYTVLGAMAATFIYWMRRHRRLGQTA